MENNKFIKSLPLFYVYAVMLLLFGIAGICMGLYVVYVRGATPGELILNKSLTLFSVGMVSSALVHFGSFKTIKKLEGQIKS